MTLNNLSRDFPELRSNYLFKVNNLYTTHGTSKKIDSKINEEELIRGRIICAVNSERLQARLLREEDFTLEKAISLCKADVESRKQLKNLTKDDSSKVNFVKHKSKKGNDELKDIGSQNFYSLYLLDLPIEYLISHFGVSSTFSC